MKNNNEIFCTSWPFELDNRYNCAFYNDVFNKEECEKIVEIGKKYKLEKAPVYGNNPKGFRNSEICWLYPNKELEFAYKRITDVIINLNKQFFGFDLQGISEPMQFTSYKSPGGNFGKHIDSGMGMLLRKLSASIQLSNPDDYEGGEVNLYLNEDPETMTKEQGSLVLFPSFVMHEVKPVTKGERNSLVVWVTGPKFK